MTVLRGFAIVFLSALSCALVGTAVGYLLGAYVPGYYQGVFRAPVQPTHIGIGLGLTQGLIAGLVVGCVVVLAVAWHNSRRQVVIQDWGRAPTPPHRPQTTRGPEAITPTVTPGG